MTRKTVYNADNDLMNVSGGSLTTDRRFHTAQHFVHQQTATSSCHLSRDDVAMLS